MSQWEKLLAKIHNNPKTVTFNDLDKLLQRAGYVRRQPRRGSRHDVYIKGHRLLTVPKHSPYVKERYVKEALKILHEEEDEEP
ncbi:type II toxin-antitoxin system HicA family toxin [Sulfobacillus thermosulfidooxidans]|uniref:type II toxin-antitoxin system HicA family toxin n=1 Tax=Sulfobacillus thermosulfidooxidans TaxID=28034 RepID=UPI0006B62456|nr:type II toxin-antitoxin system HicA family toxin [Sulfobacillus thermosulfidooxidans]